MPQTTTQSQDTTTAASATRSSRVLPFCIGADPEFLPFFNDRPLNGGEILGVLNDGSNIQLAAGGIGRDGAAIELRPKHEKTPEKLAKNIGAMIQHISNVLPNLSLTTLSLGNPIGGHIHLEVPRGDFGLQEVYTTGLSAQKRSRMIRTLAFFTYPVIMGENRMNLGARSSSSYGKIGDIRIEPKGESITFELRSPTAEWTTNEKVATAVLAYYATVWNEILKSDKEGKSIVHSALPKSIKQMEALHSLILSNHTVINKEVIKSVSSIIKDFELYPVFKKEIDFVLNAQRIMKEKEKSGWNATTGWTQKNTKKITKKDITTLKNSNNFMEKHPELNELMSAQIVPYNDDLNVSAFASALGVQTVAKKWYLENSYMLFGLKEKFSDYLIVKVTLKSRSGSNPKRDYKILKKPDGITEAETMKTVENISDKYIRHVLLRDGYTKVNPTTGKPIPQTSFTLIGIPRSDRLSLNRKRFLGIMYDLEANKYGDGTLIEKTVFSKDTGNEEETPEKKLFRITEEKQSAVVFEDGVQIQDNRQLGDEDDYVDYDED